MLSLQGVGPLRRIRRIRSSGLVGGYMLGWTLRFQKSAPGSVLLSQPEDQDEAHSYWSRAGMLSTAIVMDQTFKTI